MSSVGRFLRHTECAYYLLKAINGVDGAHDSKRFSGAGYSDAVKIRAHLFDKL